MKNRHFRLPYFAVFTIFLVSWCTANAQTEHGSALEWRDSNSEAGGFSVKLPGIRKAQQVPLAPVEASRPTVENFEGVVDAATGWLKIETRELGFKVLMPGAVRHETDQPQVKPFPLTHHTYIHSKGGNVYSAEVFGDYPPGFFKSALSYQSVLDMTLYGLKRNLEPAGFAFTPLRDLRVGAFPGREFSLDNEKLASRGRAQIYVTRKHVLVFMAFAHDQGVTLKLLDQFFGSIRVTPE
jgi:hypothetical protein